MASQLAYMRPLNILPDKLSTVRGIFSKHKLDRGTHLSLTLPLGRAISSAWNALPSLCFLMPALASDISFTLYPQECFPWTPAHKSPYYTRLLHRHFSFVTFTPNCNFTFTRAIIWLIWCLLMAATPQLSWDPVCFIHYFISITQHYDWAGD